MGVTATAPIISIYGEMKMTWEIVVGIIALVGFVISVMTPIVKLNSSITKLNCSIDALNANMRTTENRLEAHGKQIDDLRERCARHTEDILNINQRIDDLHK